MKGAWIGGRRIIKLGVKEREGLVGRGWWGLLVAAAASAGSKGEGGATGI